MQNSGMMSIFNRWCPAADAGAADAAMTIASKAGELSLGTSEVRDVFRFLLDHSKDFAEGCCWNGCREHGKPYRVKRTHLNASRFYCDRHAFSAELAGFVVVPLFSETGRS